MTAAHIVGWGMAVPERVLTNDELAEMVETSDEWIRTRTGIAERRIAGEEETASTLAIDAAQRALEVAGLRPTQLELVIVATMTPDHVFPSTACLVQDALGAGRAGAFDLAAGCSGFVYALGVAAGLIRGGLCGNALVIGAEVTSRIIDWSDRGTCVLFGDGAGAVVLRGEDRPGGVLATTLGADGSGFRLLWVPAGGGRTPPSHETVDQRLHAIDMDGRSVYRFAVRAMPEATRAVLTKAGLSMADVSLLIPHQANQRIMDAAARSLDVPKERIYSNVARYGNTSAASIPIALCEAIEEGRIQQDDVFVCVGFGGGLTWAASAVQWSEELPAEQPSRLSHWFYQLRYVYAQVRSRVRRLWRRLLARWTKD